ISGEPANSAEEAVRDCDVICSATNSSRPVIKTDWLEPGMRYNSIRVFETDLSSLDKCDVVAIHTQFGGIFHYQPPGIVEDMRGVRREKPRDWSYYPEIQVLLIVIVPGRTSDNQNNYLFITFG